MLDIETTKFVEVAVPILSHCENISSLSSISVEYCLEFENTLADVFPRGSLPGCGEGLICYSWIEKNSFQIV